MLGRALLLRCPRCGARRVIETWFKMVERCPSCRLRFERENDFFLGAYVMNLAVTEGLLIVALFAYVFRAVSDPQTPGTPVLIAALVCAIGGPLAFFPFSRTIWCAVDLAMRPVPIDPMRGDGERGPNGSGP